MVEASNLTAPPENFRAVYGRYFGCRPAAFERRIFWRCLPLWSWPVALLFKLFCPSFFNADLEFLQSLGDCRNPSEVVSEANSLACDPALNEGFLRTPLGLRLSGRRIVRVAHAIWPPLVRPTWTPAAVESEATRFVVPTPKVPHVPKTSRSAPPPPPSPPTKPDANLGRLAGPPRKRSPYNPAGARKRKQ